MTVGGLDDLYRRVILDHYQSPRHHGRLAAPDVTTQASNPLCGDEVEVSLLLKGDRIVDVAFQGQGCSISQASASMMTDCVKGKTLAEADELLDTFRTMLTDRDAPELDAHELSDLGALQGVRRYPVRVKCALLAWNVLQAGLNLYTGATGSNAGDRGGVT